MTAYTVVGGAVQNASDDDACLVLFFYFFYLLLSPWLNSQKKCLPRNASGNILELVTGNSCNNEEKMKIFVFFFSTRTIFFFLSLLRMPRHYWCFSQFKYLIGWNWMPASATKSILNTFEHVLYSCSQFLNRGSGGGGGGGVSKQYISKVLSLFSIKRNEFVSGDWCLPDLIQCLFKADESFEKHLGMQS